MSKYLSDEIVVKRVELAEKVSANQDTFTPLLLTGFFVFLLLFTVLS